MMLALIVGLGVLGAAMFAVFGALALWAYQSAGLDSSLVISELARLATLPLLRALPMFALAGYVLAESKASERLLRVSRAAIGWLPGGLTLVTIVSCTLLTAFTGASGVTLVAMGGLLLPALLKEGYRERFSLGLLTSGGNMGVLFVPSLPLILYAVIANPISNEVTIDRLFMAALAPGLLSVVALGIYGTVIGVLHKIPRSRFSLRELMASIWVARWEIPLPFVVLGGIYGGKLVVSEAAVITAAYTMIVEVLIYREIKLRDMAAIIRSSMMLVGGVLLILGMGMAITNYLVDQEVPMKILEAVKTHVHHPILFLIILNLFLLIVGCMMDIYTAIIVVVPLLVPMALEFGIHPIHLGIIFLANLAIGYSTPPVGMNLFIAAIRFDKTILQLARASLPFLLLLLLVLALITYVPALSLFSVR
ncbi:MAG TPA: C4-dicarboxylate ABC transporter [Verrucomicrobia bacterium]|nr:MAG: C4-dicarboxylate ABC transporter [Lentisphaerae bacterium GWF2_57_35]HBA84145.1 C4-dicarboxylate ABC transporter [Verrucomicrobiota bacterium]